jgi:protein-S-isoprenylcysteine O-methyltransferase Ste14
VFRAFADQPLASALFYATILVWVALELFQSVRRRANAASGDRWSLQVLRVCIAVAMVVAANATRISATAIPRGSVVFAIGLLLIWCGIALRWWCFRTLGRYFTFVVMTSADQTIVTTGPYRLLRHPSYAGVLLALCGLGVLLANWLSLLAAVVIPFIGFMYRMRVEESALTTTLGDAYTSYASTRKRLIPLVW